MPETMTLEKIRKLAKRRQALWNKMAPLTADDRAAIARLTQELEALWEEHRAELAQRRLRPDRRPANPSAVSSRSRTAA